MDLYPSRVPGVEASMLSRKDPVVWSRQEPRAGVSLSYDEATRFERDGYILCESFFSDQQLSTIRARANSIRAYASNKRWPETVLEPDSTTVRSVFGIHYRDAELAQACQHSRLVRMAEYIVGSQVYIHQSRLNFKDGMDGRAFDWHSDFETWHVEDGMPRMRALSACIFLSDNFAHNGPLCVVPGSHHHFVQVPGKTPDDHYKRSLRKQKHGVPSKEQMLELTSKRGIESITASAGSVLLFDCNLMHGSAGNLSPWPRHNLFFVLNSWENRLQAPFGCDKARPDYIAARSPKKIEPDRRITGLKH